MTGEVSRATQLRLARRMIQQCVCSRFQTLAVPVAPCSEIRFVQGFKARASPMPRRFRTSIAEGCAARAPWLAEHSAARPMDDRDDLGCRNKEVQERTMEPEEDPRVAEQKRA